MKKASSNFTNSQVFGGYSKQFGVISEETTNHQEFWVDEESPAEAIGDEPCQRTGEDIDIVSKVRAYHKELLASNLPRLSKRAEEVLATNYRYLSPAEGNLRVTVPDGKSLYITSCFPQEGKTTASISLAYNLAVFSNRTVLLVDAHFTSPTIHLVFNVTQGISFKKVLLNPSCLIQGILPTFYENLFILPNKSKKDNYGAGITPTALADFIKTVSPSFDYVIFDGRPILSAPEPVFFASTVDGVILVVESEKTKWEVVQSAVEKIENIKARIAGVVLNKRKFYIPPAIYKIL